MKVRKKFSLFSLILANAMAFSLLVGAENLSAFGGGDFCDEDDTEVEGCACISGNKWLPDGCHEGAVGGFDCETGEDCLTQS